MNVNTNELKSIQLDQQDNDAEEEEMDEIGINELLSKSLENSAESINELEISFEIVEECFDFI